MALKRFAFTLNETVFMTMAIDDEQTPKHEMWVAGLQSDPKVIEVSNDEVDFGWTRVDGQWIEPA